MRFYTPSNVFASLEDRSYIADFSFLTLPNGNTCNWNFCFLLLKVQVHPQNFDLTKFQAKSPKIWAKSLKLWTKYLKIWAKIVPKIV